MPRTALSAGNNRAKETERFPAFGLDTGETGRVWFPDEKLGFREWVHTLKAPTFEDNGRPVTEIKTRGQKQTEVYKTYFIGRQICTGNEDTLSQRDGLDPDNCMICAFVKRMLDLGIGDVRDLRAEPRYAAPVIQYTTKSKTDGTLRNPPNGTVLIWSFTQWTWEKIDRLRKDASEMLEKDESEILLSHFDIELHCANGNYKTYDEMKARRWAGRVAEVKAMLKALWSEPSNRPTDEQLEAACGRRQRAEWTARDCEDAEDAWRRAHEWDNNLSGKATGGRGTVAAVAGDDGNLDDTLTGLLDDDTAPAEDPLADHPGGLDEFAPRTPENGASENDDPFGGLDDDTAASPAAAAGGGDVFAGLDETPEDKAPATVGATSSFEGILDED